MCDDRMTRFTGSIANLYGMIIQPRVALHNYHYTDNVSWQQQTFGVHDIFGPIFATRVASAAFNTIHKTLHSCCPYSPIHTPLLIVR